jgi:serine/threonine-protein kinase
MNNNIHQTNDVVANRYKIIKYLAQGGMQEVYIATDQAFKKHVVLKTPKNISAEKRFQRSAQVSAKINHPNVAKTLDYIEHERSYLIEEFIDGNDFKFRLNNEFEFLDPHLAAHVIHHLVKGLAAAHHVGVFHRDLKPSNIMVSNDPSLRQIKLTDFGIAKMTEQKMAEDLQDVEKSITTSKTLVGALPYMAPELIEKPKKAGLPADVWSIGAILYYLMTGKPPFGKELFAVTRIIEAKLPQKPNFFAKKQFQNLTNELWKLIELCLQKNPEVRPTADELVEKCSQLCYSAAERQKGIISQFRSGTGNWGFITSDHNQNVFFHADSCYGNKSINTGLRVNFASFPGLPQPRAFPILPIKEEHF